MIRVSVGKARDWFASEITSLIVRSGHVPPPPAGDYVASIRRELGKIPAASIEDRVRAVERARTSLGQLKNKLVSLTDGRRGRTRKVLHKSRDVLLTVGASVVLAIGGNAAYDVVKGEVLELAHQQSVEAIAPASEPNDLQRAIQESVYREQLAKERKAVAEADAAESIGDAKVARTNPVGRRTGRG